MKEGNVEARRKFELSNPMVQICSGFWCANSHRLFVSLRRERRAKTFSLLDQRSGPFWWRRKLSRLFDPARSSVEIRFDIFAQAAVCLLKIEVLVSLATHCCCCCCCCCFSRAGKQAETNRLRYTHSPRPRPAAASQQRSFTLILHFSSNGVDLRLESDRWCSILHHQ